LNKSPILIAASLLALATGTVLAQAPAAPAERGHAQRPALATLDTNKDGVIDRSEAAAHPFLAQRFDRLDKNKDGKLDATESAPRAHARDHRRGGPGGKAAFGLAGLRGADSDRDGRISQAEHAAAAAARFERMDVNKDGFIDAADHQARAKQRHEAWFTAVDTDKNGSLSKAELEAAQARMAARGGHGMRGGPRHRGADTAQ
jgi:hypothetical protein